MTVICSGNLNLCLASSMGSLTHTEQLSKFVGGRLSTASSWVTSLTKVSSTASVPVDQQASATKDGEEPPISTDDKTAEANASDKRDTLPDTQALAHVWA